LRNDDAGVIYWQAPEIRRFVSSLSRYILLMSSSFCRGVYDAMKVDVWSLGATVWELIEGETPFESDPNGPSDRLPEITRTDLQQVSQGLLGFLNLCESPAERRPNARSLLEVSPFELDAKISLTRL
jgi:serine/threonine protein kinase